MAHYATNRFNYWGQFGILAAFCGTGLILGGVIGMLPLLGKIDIMHSKESASVLMNDILKPENATAIRWMQLLTTLFSFFIPAVAYGWLCHVKPYKHLGFRKHVNIKQMGLIILIMLAATPAADAFQQLTKMYPWSKATLLAFQQAEDEYMKLVMINARMDNFGDYIISMVIVALLPAVFEETLFRGALQNLLSRSIKRPILAIVITSIIFSAIHGSYLGFLSRVGLGFILGWMYYRTGNLWTSIFAHFVNNGLGVTYLYLASKPGSKIDPSKMEDHFPLMLGLVSIVVVVGLFVYFDKVSKQEIDHPGEEVLMPVHNFNNNPFEKDIANTEKPTQP